MKINRIIATDRLYIRDLTENDFDALCTILQDPEVMYAYEHAFSDEEVHDWLDRQLKRYEEYGFGLWAVTLKQTGELIGQCGITMQEIPSGTVPEIGYHLAKRYWHKGYATEAAKACKRFAFAHKRFPEVYSIIRENNLPSRAVAERLGMTVCGKFTKHYYNMDMPHLIYSVKGQLHEYI